jgi:hypothetical protein
MWVGCELVEMGTEQLLISKTERLIFAFIVFVLVLACIDGYTRIAPEGEGSSLTKHYLLTEQSRPESSERMKGRYRHS